MTVDLTKNAVRQAVKRRGGVVLDENDESIRFSVPEGEVSMGFGGLRRMAASSSMEQLLLFVDARIDTALVRLRGEPGTLDLDQVVIRLRPPSDDDETPWSRPIADGRLQLCLVEDGPEISRYLGPLEIVQSGISVDALIRLAQLRLVSMAPQGRWLPMVGNGSAVRSSVGDGNDGARFVMAGHWLGDGRGVVGLVPSRDACFVIPASDPDVLRIALSLREEAVALAQATPYPISGEVFWAHDGTVHHLPIRGRGADARFEAMPEAWAD